MTSLEILKKYWGYNAFRSLQSEIIQSVINGQNTLALLPTGGGKSICYQVPAMMLEGACVVVSPLIALMQDQVTQLSKREIPAVAIHSGLSNRIIDLELENLANGRYKLLYLSPERLLNNKVVQWLTNSKVSFIAVDEAHCISQWGHDFRPAYLKIKEVLDKMGVPCMALTATATNQVKEDIVFQLGWSKYQLYQKSFKRDNLSLSVFNVEDKEGKLVSILQKTNGSALVYTRNRQKCKDLSFLLQKTGISSSYYHAGLSGPERAKRQEDWINNKVRCMVCTNAFGMGIDKPDVRLVVHESPPDNLEAYYQEAGRAGRDGKRAYATLLFNQVDLELMHTFAEIKFPEKSFVEKLLNSLYNYYSIASEAGAGITKTIDLSKFCATYKMDLRKAYEGMKLLEIQGSISLTEGVYMPASLFVKGDYQEVYEYRMKHKSANVLFEQLLRKSQSFFDQPTRIDVHEIAKDTKLGLEKVKRLLKQLDSIGLAEYRETTDEPLIGFLKDRSTGLGMDWKKVETLKENHFYKIASVKKYVHANESCRMAALVEYFDETSAPCEICDYCIIERKSKDKKQRIDKLKTELVNLIKNKKVSLAQLKQSYSSTEILFVKEALEMLIEEGIIATDRHQTYWALKRA